MGGALKDRTDRFMRALIDGDLDATNIRPDRTSGGMAVYADIPGPHVNRAQSIAAAHGFQLYGKVEDGRYRFGTYEKAQEKGGDGPDPGTGLMGGLR